MSQRVQNKGRYCDVLGTAELKTKILYERWLQIEKLTNSQETIAKK